MQGFLGRAKGEMTNSSTRMTLSELIARAQELQEQHGSECVVLVDKGNAEDGDFLVPAKGLRFLKGGVTERLGAGKTSPTTGDPRRSALLARATASC
jgi:hypothetical protein